MKTLQPSDSVSQSGIVVDATGARHLSFFERESICEHLFVSNGPFWHVLTPGNKTQLLFVTNDDYKFCINSIAICSSMFRIRILVDAIMDNHVHMIVGGELSEVKAFFERFRKKVERYFRAMGRPVDLSDFRCDNPIPITDLKMLRNEIVYVIRNPYVAMVQALPYNYRWGSGYLYFNPIMQNLTFPKLSSCDFRLKRKIIMGRVVELPDNFVYNDGMILPVSYCKFREGEQYFRDAHQYFNLLTRNFEAYCEEARRLGDMTPMTDGELFSAISEITFKRYGMKTPSLLNLQQKKEMAILLHNDYKASNGQIRRILKMESEIIGLMFPSAKALK